MLSGTQSVDLSCSSWCDTLGLVLGKISGDGGLRSLSINLRLLLAHHNWLVSLHPCQIIVGVINANSADWQLSSDVWLDCSSLFHIRLGDE